MIIISQAIYTLYLLKDNVKVTIRRNRTKRLAYSFSHRGNISIEREVVESVNK